MGPTGCFRGDLLETPALLLPGPPAELPRNPQGLGTVKRSKVLQFASGSSLFSCTRRGGMTAGSSAVFVRAWAALHSTSLRGTRLQQLSHPKPVPAASDDTPLRGLASRGASQPRSAPWGAAGHVSHCHSGQRAKANRVSSWKSFTSQRDIKVLKPAARR